MTPSSASTVSGVVCDALRLGDPFLTISELAFGWPPIPTPASGRSLNASTVTSTSRERPLVTSFADLPPIEAAAAPGRPRAIRRVGRVQLLALRPSVGRVDRDLELPRVHVGGR